jgi:hypothetical protein
MGDLVVLTPSRAVAEWALEVARLRGRLGTGLALEPVVLLLDGQAAESLLDEQYPALGFFAAWAMQDRYGPEARSIVRRALDLSRRLPKPLQAAQQQAIYNVINERMLAYLKEVSMKLEDIPESEPMRKWRMEVQAAVIAEAEAKAKAGAILSVLAARGLAVSEGQRARLLACTDHALLERYLQRAVTAGSADEVLA